MKIISVVIFLVSLVPAFAQGVLEIEPDPFEERLNHYATSQDYLEIEEVPTKISHINDLYLLEAAYQQFSRALRNQLIVYLEVGLENDLQSLDELRILLQGWKNHWLDIRFIPDSSELTAEFIQAFYQRISIIDMDITESIQKINELIDTDRVLTTDLYPL